MSPFKSKRGTCTPYLDLEWDRKSPFQVGKQGIGFNLDTLALVRGPLCLVATNWTCIVDFVFLAHGRLEGDTSIAIIGA